MSDSDSDGNVRKKKLEQIAKGPFFAFSKPYLDFIEKGKFFSLVYFVMAIVNLILPFAILIRVIDSGVLQYDGKFTVAFIFSWLVITFACWIGFQLWWNRRVKVAAAAASEFIATAIFSEIIQTFGEWLGTLIAIIGAGAGLITSIILGSDVDYLFSVIGLGFIRFGALVIVAGPVIGFFIIVISRFAAEQLRLWAALANNTKEIAANVKTKGAA